MERISLYTKVIDFIGLIILGILVGLLYSFLSIVILVLCSPYLEAQFEMFSQIYMFYLPLAVLLTSIIFKQFNAFITILAAILTGDYLYYLWDNMRFGFF
jgi:NhaP-type Na+/H+ or K+/H+ antiporter